MRAEAKDAVYILTVATNSGHQATLPFWDLDRLKMHVCELIAKHGLIHLEEKAHRQAVTGLECKDHDAVIKIFRNEQRSSLKKLGLDFNWTGPTVIL